MTNKDLQAVLQAGEGYHVEFKQAVDKSFIEEACAFANSGGGTIFLGVADDGSVKGTDTGNASRSRIQDTLSQLEPSLKVSIEQVAEVLAISVPEGTEKPYGCSRGFFMRMGANSQKLTRNQIIEFFQKEGRIRFDELVNDKADLDDDFDPRAFRHFLDLAGISKTIDQDLLLRNLACLTPDGRFTNAGVLFFARDIDFLINHARVVCVLYKGTTKVDILDKKDFTGNLVENIENAILFVKRHTRVALKIETLQHEELPEYPEVALREAIINAVCHRDYFDKRANAVVEVYEDRVVITNPGGLPSGLRPEEFGTKSVARNPLIASLLHRIDYIEKVGTGIGRIRQAVAGLEGCSVEFRYDDFYTVAFTARQAPAGKTLLTGPEPTGSKATRQETRQVPDKCPTSTRQVLAALQTARGPLGRADLQETAGFLDREHFVNEHLRPLIDASLIEMTIPGKPRSSKQKYRLTQKGRLVLQQLDAGEDGNMRSEI